MTTARNLRLLEIFDTVEWRADPTALKPVLESGQSSKILRLHKLPSKSLLSCMNLLPITEVWETEISMEMNYYRPLKSLQNCSTIMALSLKDEKRTITHGYPVYESLKDVPKLHSLTLQNFVLSKSILSSMTRPSEECIWPPREAFPQLSVLRLHSSSVIDSDAFKSMIASHSISRLELWDSELKWDGEEMSYKTPKSSPLYLWLCKHVPEVYVAAS
ncbi:hypothetical protein OPQ81_006462 [Rhizoctonia solani]|nr:hypothetical protein OPQ81_006462 [Rhizoctonia solani]